MRRSLASLTLLLTSLLCFAGTASGAHVDASSKNRVGVSDRNPDIHTYTPGSLELEPQRGNTIIGYDPATGVVFYVNQNPWTSFDPLGLAEGLLMGGVDGNDVYGYSTAKSHAERAAITEGAQQGAKHGAIAGAVVAGGVAAATYVAEVGITAALTALAKEGASEVVDHAVEKSTGVTMATSITGFAKDGLQKLAKEGAETGLETAKDVSKKTAEIVPYDPEFATKQILGDHSPTGNLTPDGRIIMPHAAERMVTPPRGRAPMSSAEVDQVLNSGDKIRKVSPHPLGDTVTVQSTTMPSKPQVVVDADTGNRVVTVIKPDKK